jgi:hypothetical protein
MARVDTARRLQAARRKELMTLPATNKNLVLHAAPQTTSASPKQAAGWDPFEVWRTRVLLPRLAEERQEKAAAAPPAPVQLVRS